MSKMNYSEELQKAMVYLSEQEDTIFLGHSMEYGGIAIANSFKCIPDDKKIEMPVAENLQMGISTGMAITGYVPVSVYPRWNFLILAADQLVNHLDKISEMTVGQYKPKVIIRVAVGVTKPVKLETAEQILPEYQKAYQRQDGVSTILVEEHQF